MLSSRILAAILLSSFSTACGGGAPPPIEERGASRLLAGDVRVSRVEVTPDARLLSSAQQDLLRRHEAAAVLRQTALDWLDARHRFDPNGALALQLQIRAVRLRSKLSALLLGGVAGADHLEVSVVVTNEGVVVKTFAERVASAAGGRDWKDPGDRLQRMAQLLGQRVVDAL